MAEVLPSAAAAYDHRVSELEIPDEGKSKVVTETGTIEALAVRRAYFRLEALNGEISSIAYEEFAGRASLTVNYERESDDISNYGIQEFAAVDVLRDIKCAQYFAGLTNAQAAEVQRYWDSRLDPDAAWSDLQKSLYGHMAHGQESYIETAYEFRQTFQTTSAKRIKAASSKPNKVTDLPGISPSLSKLIDGVPDGEWLQKPTTVQYAGRKGWTVTLTYHWAPKWSIIYGGTFTGLD